MVNIVTKMCVITIKQMNLFTQEQVLSVTVTQAPHLAGVSGREGRCSPFLRGLQSSGREREPGRQRNPLQLVLYGKPGTERRSSEVGKE